MSRYATVPLSFDPVNGQWIRSRYDECKQVIFMLAAQNGKTKVVSPTPERCRRLLDDDTKLIQSVTPFTADVAKIIARYGCEYAWYDRWFSATQSERILHPTSKHTAMLNIEYARSCHDLIPRAGTDGQKQLDLPGLSSLNIPVPGPFQVSDDDQSHWLRELGVDFDEVAPTDGTVDVKTRESGVALGPDTVLQLETLAPNERMTDDQLHHVFGIWCDWSLDRSMWYLRNPLVLQMSLSGQWESSYRYGEVHPQLQTHVLSSIHMIRIAHDEKDMSTEPETRLPHMIAIDLQKRILSGKDDWHDVTLRGEVFGRARRRWMTLASAAAAYAVTPTSRDRDATPILDLAMFPSGVFDSWMRRAGSTTMIICFAAAFLSICPRETLAYVSSATHTDIEYAFASIQRRLPRARLERFEVTHANVNQFRAPSVYLFGTGDLPA